MPPYESLPYRPCAGIMVLNRDGLVFVGRRSSGPEHIDATHVWQMPQGGIDENEDPYQAALRELYEETNIRSVEKLGEIAEWLAYDIPRDIVGEAWGGKYRGQKQKWYALRFTGERQRDRYRQSRGGTSRNSSTGAGWRCANCPTWWCRSSGRLMSGWSRNSGSSRASNASPCRSGGDRRS